MDDPESPKAKQGQTNVMNLKQVLESAVAALLLSSSAHSADIYKIDPDHTSIAFSVRHMGINNVRGQFKEFTGIIVLAEGAIAEAKGTIQVKSVDTGVIQRDDHLRSSDFFDAAEYPTITFKLKRIKKQPVFARHRLPDGRMTIIGDFTMRGITKELQLPARLTGPAKDPGGNLRIGLAAKTKLKRKDYGINFHQVLETGALLVGEEVELEINAEAIKVTSEDGQK
jgi:polyisoprenoid-binding protein YceI